MRRRSEKYTFAEVHAAVLGAESDPSDLLFDDEALLKTLNRLIGVYGDHHTALVVMAGIGVGVRMAEERAGGEIHSLEFFEPGGPL